MDRLQKIEVEGFKLIQKMELQLEAVNVLIGANGAGKSNFISLFKMLNVMALEHLQYFIGQAGGADAILHFGAKNTPLMKVTLDFVDSKNFTHCYYICLEYAAPDTLIFAEERLSFQKSPTYEKKEILLGAGHKESKLSEKFEDLENPLKKVMHILALCQVFQFHDTSETARIRRAGNINDNIFLRNDAGNLAAFLYMLKESEVDYYKKIVSTIRLAAPHFHDFELYPDKINPNTILLDWRQKNSDYLFGPHQISDGLLRMMALTTLLYQPEDSLPKLIIIDEPELGLHPYAINLLVGMIRKVSTRCQVILATQSESLVNQFEPEDIIVVERENGASNFKRQNKEELKEWLKEYTLSELWEKNVLGGRPSL